MNTCRLIAFAVVSLPIGLGFSQTVHGVLVGSDGKPLAGAALHGLSIQNLGAGNQKITDLKATTDATGAFQIANAPSMPTADVPIELMARLPNGHFARVVLTSEGATVSVTDRPAKLKLTVTDAKGAPIVGAKLRVSNLWLNDGKGGQRPLVYSGNWWDPEPRLSAISDAQGVAVVDGLPAGEGAQYAVDKPGMVEVRKSATLPSEGEVAAAATLVPGAILSGRVMADGKPMAGVTVAALALGQYMYEWYKATSGPDGTYRIDNTPAGKLQVIVDLGDLSKEWVTKPYQDLQISAGKELGGLDFVLQHGIVVSGHVRTLDLDRPVVGATVNISNGPFESVDVKTDAQGGFSGRALPGDCHVSVTEIRSRRPREQYDMSATLDATHNPPIDLHVPDVLLFDPIQNLTGRVTDGKGNPTAGAIIHDLNSAATATTDANGNFRFTQITNPGDQIVASKGELASGKPVALVDKTNIELKLDSKLAAIEGTAIGEDLKPLVGAEINLGGKFWGQRDVKTDSEGRYKFLDLYAGSGTFFLWAKKAGYGAATIQPIKLNPGEHRTLDGMYMRLADGVIDGKVVEADGKPAKGATVSSQTQESPNVQTDDQGRFHLTNVPRGRHYVIAGRDNSFGDGAYADTGAKDVVIHMAPPHAPNFGQIIGDRSGQAAPELKVANWVTGNAVSLAGLKGKIVVLDFWAVWCSPCVADLPKVEAVAKRYADRGVIVLGIHAVGTPASKVKEFLKTHRLSYPIALDLPDANGQGASAARYVPRGIPSVFVIAPDGRIVSDSNEIETAEKAVQKLLGAKQ